MFGSTWNRLVNRRGMLAMERLEAEVSALRDLMTDIGFRTTELAGALYEAEKPMQAMQIVERVSYVLRHAITRLMKCASTQQGLIELTQGRKTRGTRFLLLDDEVWQAVRLNELVVKRRWPTIEPLEPVGPWGNLAAMQRDLVDKSIGASLKLPVFGKDSTAWYRENLNLFYKFRVRRLMQYHVHDAFHDFAFGREEKVPVGEWQVPPIDQALWREVEWCMARVLLVIDVTEVAFRHGQLESETFTMGGEQSLTPFGPREVPRDLLTVELSDSALRKSIKVAKKTPDVWEYVDFEWIDLDSERTNSDSFEIEVP